MLTSVRSLVQGSFSDSSGWASLSVISSHSVMSSSFIGPLIVTMLPKVAITWSMSISATCAQTPGEQELSGFVSMVLHSLVRCPAHNREFSQYWCISDGVHGCMHAWTWALPLVDAPLSYLPIFPSGSDGKASAHNAGDQSSIPGLGRSPEEGHGNPLQYSRLENPMDRGAW